MRQLYLQSFLFIVSQVAFSRHYLPVEHFSKDNGLLNSDLTCLFQDKTGFLWIGTKNGLFRYDGYNFNEYMADLSDSSAISGNHIVKILEDAQNELWVVSKQGISRYLREKDKFKTYYLSDLLAGNRISPKLKDAAIDWKRNIILLLGDDFLGKFNINTGKFVSVTMSQYILNDFDRSISSLTYNGLYNTFILYGNQSIFRFDTANDSLYFVTNSEIRKLYGEGIAGLTNIISGECLVFTRDRLFVYTDLSTLKEMDISSLIRNNEITGLLQNQSGSIYIVTGSSIIEYDLLKNKGKELFTYSIQKNQKLYPTSTLFMEPGIFWIGTRNGLYKFNNHQNFFTEHSTSKYFTEKGSITALAFDEKGFLWLGNNAGELVVLEPEAGQESLDIVSRVSTGHKIMSFENDETGDQLFMGTDEGLFSIKLTHSNSITEKIVFPGNIENFCRNNDTLWIANKGELFIVSTNNKFKSESRLLDDVIRGPVIDMFSIPGAIFLLQSNQITRHKKADSSSIILSLSQLNLSILPENLCFTPLNNKELIVGTNAGLFIYYLYDFKVLPSYLNIRQLALPMYALYQYPEKHLWISTNNGIINLNKPVSSIRNFNSSDGLSFFSYKNGLVDKNLRGVMCVAGEDHFVLFNADSIPVNRNIPKVEITGIELHQRGRINTIKVFGLDTLDIETKYSNILFKLAALDYWDSQKNTFQYSLQRDGKPDIWVDLGTKNFFYNPTRLRTGEYVLKIRGANNDGIWSKESRELIINMIAPWWRSRIAIVSYTVFFFLLIYLIILFTTRQLRRINREYREKEFIARKVEMQKEELTVKNKNITDSINYAKRIQMALMPSEKLFKKFFPDSFILHLPKDIVSGDFYWVNEVNGRIYFAAVDCTGHGVPGAFMSIIGFELFRRITEIEKKRQPAEILKSLNQGFETIFKDIENIVLRDGMDVAFCAVDPELKVLEYSGAFNPLYLVRDNSITEIKGDRFSVGLNQLDIALPSQPFNDHVVPLKDGDIIYIFTDGYADQFGGPDGKKYKYRRFRHLLLALHQLPMDRQVEFLRRSIMDWKGDLDQVDDILVMGIRISHGK